MAQLKRVASLAEVLGAQAFLRFLGADWHNSLLIIAVVSFLRAQTVGPGAKFHNPFGLHPGTYDTAYRSGVKKVFSHGHYETISTYKNLTKAFQALASYFKNNTDYKLVVQALKRNDPNDFLMAIALSDWDASHYGLPYDNRLYNIYATFTGLTLPAPPAKKPPKPRKFYPLPAALQPSTYRPVYLSGFAPERFYRERHPRIRPS